MDEEIKLHPFIEKYIWQPIFLTAKVFLCLFWLLPAIYGIIWFTIFYPLTVFLTVLFLIGIVVCGSLLIEYIVREPGMPWKDGQAWCIAIPILILGMMIYMKGY